MGRPFDPVHGALIDQVTQPEVFGADGLCMQAVVAPRPTAGAVDWQAPAMVALSALVAFVATVPLASMIAKPVQALVEAAPGSPGSALGLAFMLIGPLGYVLFLAMTWATLNGRTEHSRFVHTIRWASLGLVPHIVLSLVGILWHGGPRLPMLVAAAITLPAAALGAIWASAQSED